MHRPLANRRVGRQVFWTVQELAFELVTPGLARHVVPKVLSLINRDSKEFSSCSLSGILAGMQTGS
jgi:hypothetical protein